MLNKMLPYKVLLNDLISVTYDDRFVGQIEKWKAHQNTYLQDQNSLPHRAFSIFLFNHQNQLLLQRRSNEKKTFPLCWTNTCCSHPNMVQFQDYSKGEEPIRESLHRALDRELKMNLRAEKFYFIKKILYKSESYKTEEEFGEFQVDYIYCVKISEEVKYEIVQSEIKQISWISRQNLPLFVEQKTKEGAQLTPWFIKIYQTGLLDSLWKTVENNELRDEKGQNEFSVENLIDNQKRKIQMI